MTATTTHSPLGVCRVESLRIDGFVVTDIEELVPPEPARVGKDRRQLPSWRWEELRTTLWVVPSILIVASVLLFLVTFEIDLAAFHDH